MATTTRLSYHEDPTLYLYTSLTAGSSHIITATSRLETILKANKIPFRALDVATDEKARMLWGRRSKGRKLPGLVKFGSVIGDLDEVEEWNEYQELKEHLGPVPNPEPIPMKSTATTPSRPSSTEPPKPETGAAPTTKPQHVSIKEPPEYQRKSSLAGLKKDDTPLTMAIRQAGAEAASKAGQKKIVKPGSPFSDEPEAPGAVPSAVQARLSEASEDPEKVVELTAAKTPAQLAVEGAKRTTVDKIAESETSADADAQEGLSKEEIEIRTRRASSLTKTRSSLSNETAVVDTEYSQGKPSSQRHTGSIVSSTTKDDTAEVEKQNTIPEEPEEERGPDEEVPEKKAAGHTLANITASNMGENPTATDAKPREQKAKDEEAAGISVGD